MTGEEFEETGLSIGARIQGSSVVGVGRKELEEEWKKEEKSKQDK